MNEQFKLPIGEEFLGPLRKNGFYYVDKTMMLAKFLRSRGSVNLFTRPRRFGKSLTLDMFKSFLEKGTDPSVFEGLEITKEKELCSAYMGRYPVIFISLKSVEGSTYEKALLAMSSLLREEARRHQYLLESDRLSAADKKALERLYGLYLEEDAQRESLRLLSQMLAKHFGENAVLLIDEYDVPLDKAWQKGYYEEMVEHLRIIFGNALKTNPSVEFAIITGCLRIARESIFTGLNNFKVNTISDIAFAEDFGFTDAEVRSMLSYYGISEKYDLFKEWYDGYHFGKSEMYCPWDVINQTSKFLENPHAQMESHWINSSSNSLIRDIIQDAGSTTRADLEMLISGKTVEKPLFPELTYRDLESGDEDIRQTYLWSVLYSTGYLTDADVPSGRLHRLIIPNREIMEIYKKNCRIIHEEEVLE